MSYLAKIWLVSLFLFKISCMRETPPNPGELMHYEEIPPQRNHTATVFFLHRAGFNGTLMREWVQLMIGNQQFPHIKIVFPTAPYLPYKVLENRSCNIWYDQHQYAFEADEILESFQEARFQLQRLMNEELKKGIKPYRIIFGGFSMGGVMALHLAYRCIPGLGGAFALSSFLPRTSVVFRELNSTIRSHDLPPLLMATGASDEFILERWVRHNVEMFRYYGIEVDYHVIPETLHAIHTDEMVLLWRFWQERIPVEDPLQVPSSSSEDSKYDEKKSGKKIALGVDTSKS